MKILVSNDDGINAPGLKVLVDAVDGLGEVFVVAPNRERSACGHSLTMHEPVRAKEVQKNVWSVSGTPADCIFLATHKLLQAKPDIVVSGVNPGPNLGFDVFYSGTVSAAREGIISGMKGVAVSLATPYNATAESYHWETAKHYARMMIEQALESKYDPKSAVINVNVPNQPMEGIKGVKVTTQGFRHYAPAIIAKKDPRGREYYWIAGTYEGYEKEPISDCQAIDQDYVSITPLGLDTTNPELSETIKSWI
jgi:5'-nucleotidase